jgi:hypothetical protein
MQTESELSSALVKKLANLVVGGDDLPASANHFVSFCYPGIAVEATDFDFGFVSPSGAASAAAADYASLVNTIPPTSGRFAPSIQSLPDVYAEMMRDKQLPTMTLSEDEKKRLSAALALISREVAGIDPATGGLTKRYADTPLYEKYKELEQAYIAAGIAQRTLQMDMLFRGDDKSKAEWALKGKYLTQAVKSAYNAWLPYKSQIDDALGTIAALSGRGPAVYWKTLQDRYEQSRLTTPEGEEYVFTKYFPTRFYDAAQATGWSKFLMTHEEVHEINSSSSMSASIGGGFSAGLWSASASGSYAEQKSYFKSDTQNVSIEAQLTLVTVRRTWLDATVFSNRAWRFDPQVNKSVLSDGATPPSGRLPAIITGLILAKGVKLGIDMSSTENASFASQLSASASAGWGPFSIRGNYSRNTSRTTHDFIKSAAGIESPGMQILGFVGEYLPKCPDPDTTLSWPK